MSEEGHESLAMLVLWHIPSHPIESSTELKIDPNSVTFLANNVLQWVISFVNSGTITTNVNLLSIAVLHKTYKGNEGNVQQERLEYSPQLG